MNAIVIGVGTGLRGDDGVGEAVLAALDDLTAKDPRIRLARCDGEPARMIELWDGFDRAIVVDAARNGETPCGHVYRRVLVADVDRPHDAMTGVGEPAGNGHAAGFGAAIRLAHALDRLPPHLTLYAVVGRDFDLGAPLSPPVAEAARELAALIRAECEERVADRSAPARDQSPGGDGYGGPGDPGRTGGNLGA